MSDTASITSSTSTVTRQYKSRLLQAKEAKKLVEQDAQTLKNRIALLKVRVAVLLGFAPFPPYLTFALLLVCYDFRLRKSAHKRGLRKRNKRQKPF